jgi:hypothetical protein
MWFYPIAGVLLILGIAGGALFGGIFTIVLVPLAAIALATGVVYGMWGRAAQGSEGAETEATNAASSPLPHRRRGDSGRAPSSPERLADARRVQQ